MVTVTTLATSWVSKLSHDNYLSIKIGYTGNKFLVVNADCFDNVLCDNHKAVLVTTVSQIDTKLGMVNPYCMV